MIKKKIFWAIIAIVASFAVSCQKTGGVKKVSALVKVDESGISADTPKPGSYKVILTNSSTTKADTVETENGMALVGKLIPGTYSVLVSGSSTDGVHTYTFTGALPSVSVLAEETQVTVAVNATKASGLVIKSFYASGTYKDKTMPESPDFNKTYFRDQYWEIYNNSEETVYADGIAFAKVEYANWDYSTIYQWNIPNPEKYIAASTIWQIPGSGKDYPVKPGESFVVAQWATDHTSKNLCDGYSIDLSGADFEAIEGESTLWNGLIITDGNAINMKRTVVSMYKMPQWLVAVTDAALVVFKPSKELKNEDFITATNDENIKVREIAIEDVLDAVQYYSEEAIWADATRHNLPVSLDAGCVFFKKYTTSAFTRKVASTRKDGIVVYQDTNNMTNDFEKMEKPEIRANGAGKPAWNKWAK